MSPTLTADATAAFDMAYPSIFARIAARVCARHLDRLVRVRAERDADAHARAMNRLRADAADGENLMPAIVAAVEAYATIGEMCNLLRRQYGEYREPLAV